MNLEDDMSNDAVVISYLKDEKMAREFYSALCNMRWVNKEAVRNLYGDDRMIIETLKGEDLPTWSCSWRYAGGIIADIRNKNYNTEETYLDYYCAGNEGTVSDLVEECFRRMGWTPIY